MSDKILEIKDCEIQYITEIGIVHAVNHIDFSIERGASMGLVGETGAGKTTTCLGILNLLPSTTGRVTSGEIIFNGENLLKKSDKEMQKIRGSQISMVFQDPMSSLNPTIPIGKQMVEAIKKHHKISTDEAKKRAKELMRMVEIDDVEERFHLQPHFFSGGMRQRCVLAMALASEPKVIFADEPTTALDVTVQAKILKLIRELKEKTGVSFVFISHDLGVVAGVADRVAIMYAGKIVEIGTAEEIFYTPRHPYTWGLLSALPAFADKSQTLQSIPGTPPTMIDLPKGDAFAVRNKYAMKIDYEETPPMFQISPTHYAATWLLDSRAPIVYPPREVLRYTTEIGEERY